ncbi:MAG: hypothetical protein ABW140_13225, partial [Candidatus Sedimenticola sp. 6PFRAG1]
QLLTINLYAVLGVTAFTQWLAGESLRSVTSKAAPPSLQARSAQAKANGKPFAALGKVIG